MVNVESVINNGGTLLAIIVLGEALALSGLTSHGIRMGTDWVSPENTILLVSDYSLASLLLYLIYFTDSMLAICFALGSLGLTHLFRCLQRVVGMPRPFCASTPVTLLNIGKLVLAAVLWGICFASKGMLPV